jgi:hypothetical protein
MLPRLQVALALVCLAGAAACTEKKRTEIVVGLATDLAAPAPLYQVSLQVTKLPDGFPLGQATSYPISGVSDTIYELPGTYGIYSDSGAPDRVRVVLTATDDQFRTLVVRSAVFNLVPEKTLFVRLGVISACQGMTDCGQGMTCIEGRCTSEQIDSSRLPNYRPGFESTVECASSATFVDTSTKVPLTQTAASCATGTCAEGVCLSPPAAGGGGGAPGAAGSPGLGGGGPGGRGGAGGVGGAGGQMVVTRPASLKATYQLNQTFAADQPSAPALVAVDPQAASTFVADTVLGVTRTVWAFNGLASPPDQQAGLALVTPGLVNPQSYSVDMVVELTAGDGGWRRLLDVQDRQSDDGFYVDPSNNLDIYRISGSTAAFTTGAYHHVAMTVDGTAAMPIVRAYLDGVLQFSSLTSEMALDADPASNPDQVLGIFLDNIAGGGQGEWSPGRLAILRLWDGVLTDMQAAALAASPFTAR